MRKTFPYLEFRQSKPKLSLVLLEYFVLLISLKINQVSVFTGFDIIYGHLDF